MSAPLTTLEVLEWMKRNNPYSAALAADREAFRANLLSDEAVERAALAAYRHEYPGWGLDEIPEYWGGSLRDMYRNFAKACIEAAINAALGEAT